MTTITKIINSHEELAAFPINGNVAFLLSDMVDSLEDRILVYKKNNIYPNELAYLYSQYGRENNPIKPDYSITKEDITNKVIISFNTLEQASNYDILINLSDIYGDLSSSNIHTDADILVKNYYIGADQLDSVGIEILESSSYLNDVSLFLTKVKILTVNGERIETIKSMTPFLIDGLAITLSNDMFLMGDTYNFSFRKLEEKDIVVINLKTSNIENLTQILENQSKEANELDLIQFYEETKNNIIAPDQPLSILKILKSNSSLVIFFKDIIDLSTLNISAFTFPAFNNINIPEEDWVANVKLTLRLIAPNILNIKIEESTSGSNEIIKNV